MSQNIHVAQLNSPEQLGIAYQIVHDIYAKELNIPIINTNPSSIDTLTVDSHQLYFDSYSCDATWFGLFNHQQLIGCIRCVNFSDPLNLKELAHYFSNCQELSHASQLGGSIALGRFAVRKEFRHLHGGYHLLRAAVEYCKTLNQPASAFIVPDKLYHCFERLPFEKHQLADIPNRSSKYCTHPTMFWLPREDSKMNRCLFNLNKKISNAQKSSPID